MWSVTGNCGNVNLRFFTVNYTICSFSHPKTVNLMVTVNLTV